jgi:hypothetical protein
MAAKTAIRILRRIAFAVMHIMTGGSRHGRRRPIAAAPLQRADLISMHIRLLDRINRLSSEAPVQRLVRAIRERWS